MKRSVSGDSSFSGDARKMKKVKLEIYEEEEMREKGKTSGGYSWYLDDDLLFEVLKHADARTVATAACVSKQWHKTAQDERLWELICTRHWPNIGCGNQQLRSVVLALGGFRRLHSHCLLPLSKPQSASSSTSASSSASAWSPFPAMIGPKPPTRWGKDEVHLSLSLLSIRYYERMNFNNRSSR